LLVVVALPVVADVESVRSGVLLVPSFWGDDAMDGIADVGSACRWLALVFDRGSILAHAATLRAPVLSDRPSW
jgi:hypothetical protein